MLKDFFKKNKYITVSTTNLQNKDEEGDKPFIPDNLWKKCDGCGRILYNEDIESNLKVCTYCHHHFRLSSKERINMILDEGTFKEFNANMKSVNPLHFDGYEEKVYSSMEKMGINEAVITVEGKIYGEKAIVCVMDSYFMMGSMGSVVGEKITRAIERAIEKKLPIIIFTTSGGARMQEGILSLMQMAKVSGALTKLSEAGQLYITVLTDPTTGGVTASFAMLGDIILSEPGALVGFAGRRVIEKTIGEALPEDFQKAEFLLQKGFIDKIVHRKELKNTLSKIILLHKEI
ncbi:acetyl-CoA carboxylase, carboxyltransferase subunit beta [Desnuesiella massiliensis]|uniref:acetyl-CoA carboxylase, carboxyltransferase subunit beta n=1 Tax=Desnuesiella massiliensis TaxID=1650662 RepID=UPI0006E3BCA4|nr:acetyl-CoA carboxylase, carboxyltransferase subunit beta [Desnuesiella massiliensis]